MRRALFFFGLVTFATLVGAETQHGPNINPSNFAVLVEWERFTNQKAGIIGDNLSAASWRVFEEADSWQDDEPKGAIAQQLRRWRNAFDGNGVLEGSEGEAPYLGRPRGALSDYVVELAVPMFPNRMAGEDGGLQDSNLVADRWQMGRKESRHHSEARKAFRALAAALVELGLGEARLRLAWEFTGDWFPWGLDPQSETAGTPEEFKECWKFIYLTMEAVNPKFTWVWNSSLGFDHFDPSQAFPEYPGETFLNAPDQADKVLVDFISADFYDADGDCYYRPEEGENEDEILVPGYWNAHPKEQEKAFQNLEKKLFEGRGHLAKDGDSSFYGLRFFKELADQKKLPFAISEWGPWANYVPQRNSEEKRLLRSIGYGGDDNPYFIEGAFRWFRENGVTSACLFEFYNGGEGDTVDHTLLPGYWNSAREGRPKLSLYPEDSPFHQFDEQLHPRAAASYLRHLKARSNGKP